MFPTCASAIVHNFIAHTADATVVQPLKAGATISTGAAYLPELDVDLVVDWPMRVSRQAAKAQSTLTGRHLILMAMRSPLIADDHEITLVVNDTQTITIFDQLRLHTNDEVTFWLSPTDHGGLHFQLRRDGLFPRLSPPWRSYKERRTGFARAADRLTDRLLYMAS